MRLAGANIGIGTTNPTARLDVNGDIKATGITVTGTISATNFTGTFNGEQPPVSYTIGTNNLGTWRDVLIDGTALLGDADGGRIKMLIRNHADKTVRVWVWDFYCENDTDNFAQAGRWGMTAFNNGGESYFILGMGNTANRYEIASIGNWAYLRNYRSGLASGGVDASAETFANRYKFWFMLPPNISGTVILFDR